MKIGIQVGILAFTLGGCDYPSKKPMSTNDEQTKNEPQFIALGKDDPDMEEAYERASMTLQDFKSHLQIQDDRFCSMKLRFRDPEESERLGEDCFAYLWLGNAKYHEDEGIFSAEFFELPEAFQKWHHVGERLEIDPEDIFDWMVIDTGRLYGGWTLRVGRERVPNKERDEYDSYIGVSKYMQDTAPVNEESY